MVTTRRDCNSARRSPSSVLLSLSPSGTASRRSNRARSVNSEIDETGIDEYADTGHDEDEDMDEEDEEEQGRSPRRSTRGRGSDDASDRPTRSRSSRRGNTSSKQSSRQTHSLDFDSKEFADTDMPRLTRTQRKSLMGAEDSRSVPTSPTQNGRSGGGRRSSRLSRPSSDDNNEEGSQEMEEEHNSKDYGERRSTRRRRSVDHYDVDAIEEASQYRASSRNRRRSDRQEAERSRNEAEERRLRAEERSLRAARRSSRRSNRDEEDNDELQDTDSSSSESEEEQGRSYSFRDRRATTRQTFNVSEMGGDSRRGYEDGKNIYNLKGYGSQFRQRRDRERDNRDYGDGGRRGSRDSRDSRDYQRNYNYSQRLYLGSSRTGNGGSKSRRESHHRRRHKGHRRHYDSSSESSHSSGGEYKYNKMERYDRPKDTGQKGHDEDENFRRYEADRLLRERESIQPLDISMMGGGSHGMGGSTIDRASRKDMLRVDATPLTVDSGIGFQSVGGLNNHIKALKEMVVLPLLYPELFEKFDTQPPRGVLFTGPPGTGKTLTARALANSVSMSQTGGRKVSFFMRKGADCLSKWVGEGERQLRLLFEQAKRYQPSIIFFDEIDGLAPVRSVKQDQIHASIVSTLLALMDGLDARGQVIIIGATNRPDAIDPALRRPGRFDRELLFPLPDAQARSTILDIHTAKWTPPLTQDVKRWIIQNTAGYCGADMKAFCAEAALVSLRRSYPQVYKSSSKLDIDISKITVSTGDFAAALNKIVPTSRRSNDRVSKPLDVSVVPLLSCSLEGILRKVKERFPVGARAILAKQAEEAKDKEYTDTDAVPVGGGEKQTPDLSLTVANEGNKVQFGQNELSNLMKDDRETWISSLMDVQSSSVIDASVDTVLRTAGFSAHNNNNSGRDDYNNSSSTSSMSVPFSFSRAGSGLSSSSTSQRNSQVSMLYDNSSITFQSRVMVYSTANMGQNELAGAALQYLESFPSYSLDLTSLLTDMQHTSPEQALVSRINEAYKAAPAIVYLPNVTSWWRSVSSGMQSALCNLLANIPSNAPVLWLTTLNIVDLTDSSGMEEGGVFLQNDAHFAAVLRWLAGEDYSHIVFSLLSKNAQSLLDTIKDQVGAVTYQVARSDVTAYFKSFFDMLPSLPAQLYAARKQILLSRNQVIASVEGAPGQPVNGAGKSSAAESDEALAMELQTEDDAPRRLTRSQANGTASPERPRPRKKEKRAEERVDPKLVYYSGDFRDYENPYVDPAVDERDAYHLRELRNFLRLCVAELFKDRRYVPFYRPVDPEVVPDYYDVVKCPMDLETMRSKVDDYLYPSLAHFLRDLDQIVFNAKEYNPRTLKDVRGRQIVSNAHSLEDVVQAHAYRFKKEIGYDLFKRCDEIVDRRKIPAPHKPKRGDKLNIHDVLYYEEALELHEELKEQRAEEEEEERKREEEDEKRKEADKIFYNGLDEGKDSQLEEIDGGLEAGDDEEEEKESEVGARRSSRRSARVITEEEEEEEMTLHESPARKRGRGSARSRNMNGSLIGESPSMTFSPLSSCASPSYRSSRQSSDLVKEESDLISNSKENETNGTSDATWFVDDDPEGAIKRKRRQEAKALREKQQREIEERKAEEQKAEENRVVAERAKDPIRYDVKQTVEAILEHVMPTSEEQIQTKSQDSGSYLNDESQETVLSLQSGNVQGDIINTPKMEAPMEIHLSEEEIDDLPDMKTLRDTIVELFHQKQQGSEGVKGHLDKLLTDVVDHCFSYKLSVSDIQGRFSSLNRLARAYQRHLDFQKLQDDLDKFVNQEHYFELNDVASVCADM